jgi:acetyltransferase-like isoleucine patch superfamily enzyme/glycine cleavage system H lipoate-binding protein
MRHDITLAQIDVNDDELRLSQYQYKNKDFVEKDSIVLTCESSKAVMEVACPYSGYIYFFFEEDSLVEVNSIIAAVFDSVDEYEHFIDVEKNNALSQNEDNNTDIKATAKAKKLALENNVDITEIKKEGIIKESDIVSFLEKRSSINKITIKNENSISRNQKKYKYDNERIVVIGAGKGAQVLIDILLDYTDRSVILLVDDSRKEFYAYNRQYEVSPFGIFEFADKIDRNSFDTAIISIASNLKSMQLREKIYNYYIQQDIIFTNVIAKNAEVRRGVVLGNDNIIGDHAYIGTMTVIGNNNFISYNTIVGHHNVIGDTNLIAPGVITSGTVSIGNNCIIPAGVVCINKINIGDNVILPLGYNVSENIASNIHIKGHVPPVLSVN